MPETITLGRLDGEVRQMLAKGGIDPRHASIVLHKPLEREHAKNRRRYAQCIPDELVFEFATATLILDEAHRTALVAHEVGHCIAWRERGEHGEDDADEAARRVLGIPICYDRSWPGKGLQVDCRLHRATQRVANPRPSQRGWPKQGTPPSDPRDYVRKSEIDAWYRGNYVQRDKVVASSRKKKVDYPRYELGTWKIDDQFRGMYGHEIDELVIVADPRTLEPGEFDWSDPTKALRQSGKLHDMERYAEWMAEGHSYPPVHVVETERGTLRITDGHRRAAAADSKGLPIKAWVSWLTDHPEPPPDRDMSVGLTYELATGQEWTMPRAANPQQYHVEMNYDFEWQTASYIASPSADAAIAATKQAARDKGWDLVDQAKWRATKVKNPKRKNPPKGPPFTPAEVEEIREDIGQCVSIVADRRKLSAKYDEVAASEDVVPVRMKLTRRGAQQADLFGNPDDPADMTDRALLDEIYEIEQTGGPGALKRTDAQWKRLDALLDEVILRQKQGRFSTRERNVANPRRRRNLQEFPAMRFDGPMAKKAYEQLRSGAVVPLASVADAGTGAYMALLPTNEIFHVDTDRFVFLIGYPNAAEAKDDYDYLLEKFPRLMNPRSSRPRSISSKDARAIEAFVERRQSRGEKLQSDGQRLSLRPSGREIARWSGPTIYYGDEAGSSTFVRDVKDWTRNSVGIQTLNPRGYRELPAARIDRAIGRANFMLSEAAKKADAERDEALRGAQGFLDSAQEEIDKAGSSKSMQRRLDEALEELDRQLGTSKRRNPRRITARQAKILASIRDATPSTMHRLGFAGVQWARQEKLAYAPTGHPGEIRLTPAGYDALEQHEKRSNPSEGRQRNPRATAAARRIAAL